MLKLNFLPYVKIYQRSFKIPFFSKPILSDVFYTVSGASTRYFGQKSNSFNAPHTQLSEDVKRNEGAVTVGAKGI